VNGQKKKHFLLDTGPGGPLPEEYFVQKKSDSFRKQAKSQKYDNEQINILFMIIV
jgi:hypothetical protein